MEESNKQLKVNDLFDEFITAKVIQNLSDRTIGYYKENLGYFFRFKQVEYINDYTKSDIANYIMLLKNSAVTDNTINTRLRAIKVFFKYIESEYSLVLPKIKLLKTSTKCKQIHSVDNLKKLLETPNYKNYVQYRNWIMVQVMLSTGARLSSIQNLRIKDVDFTNAYINYEHSKNGESYSVPLDSHIKDALKTFIDTLPKTAEYLFCTKQGKQLTTISIQSSIKRYCESKGLDKGFCYTHIFRRQFATNIAKETKDYILLQKLLAHKTPYMSMHYVNITNDDAKEAIDRYSIFNKLH